MSSEDGLSALRAALLAGRPCVLRPAGDGAAAVLSLDGVDFAALSETSFHAMREGTRGRRYKLLALWVQWNCRDKGYAEHLVAAKAAGLTMTDMVLITDKVRAAGGGAASMVGSCPRASTRHARFALSRRPLRAARSPSSSTTWRAGPRRPTTCSCRPRRPAARARARAVRRATWSPPWTASARR